MELEFGDVGFGGRRKTREPGEKSPVQGENQEQTQPTWHRARIEPGLHFQGKGIAGPRESQILVLTPVFPTWAKDRAIYVKLC